jgi:hypothetical protein
MPTISFNRQMRQEGLNVNRPQFARMTATVKFDEAPHPLQIGPLRSVRHVARADFIACNLEQPASLGHIIPLGVLRDTIRNPT